MLKELCDLQASQRRCSIPRLFDSLSENLSTAPEIRTEVESLRLAVATERLFRYIGQAILRNAFFIELVNDSITSTKFQVRWTPRLVSDPRHATYEECLEICRTLVGDLLEAWNDPQKRKLVRLFWRYRVLPYEAPIDYLRLPQSQHDGMHKSSDIGWFWDETYHRTLGLRQFLLDNSTNPRSALFKKIINDKVKVKTYLTDRVLTGEHKTNREKRWETHPASVHFAFRRACLGVEQELMLQLCRFEGFPSDLLEHLRAKELVPPDTEVFRCPITRDILPFEELAAEMETPYHGKSGFQVGHLNPLKAITDEPSLGHTRLNVSWISYDGNRIQGSLPVSEVRTLLRRISANYSELGESL